MAFSLICEVTLTSLFLLVYDWKERRRKSDVTEETASYLHTDL